MATELGQAYVQIMPSAKGISGSISKQLGSESASAGKSAGSKIIGAIKGAIAVAAIGKSISASLMEGADLQQSLGGIETLFKDNADKVKKYADEAYKTTGLSANAYMENVTGFSASLLQSLGGDTEKAAEKSNMAMIDMADNSNKMGTSMESIQNAYQGFAKQNYTMLDNLKLGYGGTKSEMERLLADATKLTGVKYDINNLSDVYSAINAVQGELGITGTTAKESAETFSGSMASMKASFSNFLGNLSLGKDVGSSLSALASTISTFLFNNLLPMLGNIAKALPGALITFVQEFAPRLIEEGGKLIANLTSGVTTSMPVLLTGLQDMLTNAMTSITENLPMFLEKGTEIIQNLANGIIENVPSVVSGVSEVISNFTTFISESLPDILNSGKDLLLSLVDGILENIPSLIDSASDIIANFTKFILDSLPKILKTGKDLLLSLVDGIIKNLPAIVDSAIKGVNKFLSTVKEKLPQVLASGKETILSLVNGIINNLPALVEAAVKAITGFISTLVTNLPSIIKTGVEFIVSLAKGLIQAIPNLVSKLPQIITAIVKGLTSGIGSIADVGLNMVKGLWNGISDATGWILDKIKGFGNSVLEGIKKIFGIHSPSTVFRDEVGKNLALGLGEGFTGEMDSVTKDMANLAEDVLSSFNIGNPLSSAINDLSMNQMQRGLFYAGARVIPLTNSQKDRVKQESKEIKLDVNVNIENFNNNTESDIETIADEIAFQLQRKIEGRGGLAFGTI